MHRKTEKSIHVLGVCLLIVYLLGLAYFLFLAESYGHGVGTYSYNLVPFREIGRFIRYRDVLGTRAVVLNLAGNILGFMPFGALLPLLMPSTRRIWRIGLLSLEVSLVIELSQLLFSLGCFDVDDLILNTCGGLLGYLVFCLARGLRRSAAARRRKSK